MERRIKYWVLSFILFAFFAMGGVRIFSLELNDIFQGGFLIVLLFLSQFSLKRNSITKYSFLVAFKFLFTTGTLFYGYFNDGILMMFRGLTIPILNNYLLIKKYNSAQIRQAIVFLSDFIILSFLPYILHIIPETSKGYSLANYGVETHGILGIFYNPHGAASAVSLALLIELFFIIKSKRISIFKVFIFIVGFYVMYKTYVRTGYAMFIVGSMVLFYYEFKTNKFYKVLPFVLSLILGIVYIYNNSSVLRKRIWDESKYNKHYDPHDINTISSGRIILWMASIKNIKDQDVISLLIGQGFKRSIESMKESTGLSKIAHNGFLDMLLQNGILGILFFLLFLKVWYKLIKSRKSSMYYSLGMAVFISYIVFNVLQGGNGIFFDTQVTLVINLLLSDFAFKKEKDEKNCDVSIYH